MWVVIIVLMYRAIVHPIYSSQLSAIYYKKIPCKPVIVVSTITVITDKTDKNGQGMANHSIHSS